MGRAAGATLRKGRKAPLHSEGEELNGEGQSCCLFSSPCSQGLEPDVGTAVVSVAKQETQVPS